MFAHGEDATEQESTSCVYANGASRALGDLTIVKRHFSRKLAEER